MDRQKQRKIIFEHFGLGNQVEKLMEELHELIDAIQDADVEWHTNPEKLILDGDLVSEACDVLVLLNQLMENRPVFREAVEEQMQYKELRTIDRIRAGYYDREKKEGGIGPLYALTLLERKPPGFASWGLQHNFFDLLRSTSEPVLGRGGPFPDVPVLHGDLLHPVDGFRLNKEVWNRTKHPAALIGDFNMDVLAKNRYVVRSGIWRIDQLVDLGHLSHCSILNRLIPSHDRHGKEKNDQEKDSSHNDSFHHNYGRHPGFPRGYIATSFALFHVL